MSCNLCLIFHDGILKGECKCKNCTCYGEWLYDKNREINKPSLFVLTEKCKCGHWDFEHTIFDADKKRYCGFCICNDLIIPKTCVGCLEPLENDLCINSNCPINGAQN